MVEDVKYSVERELAVIGANGSAEKRLCLIIWNRAPAKLDLRVWRNRNGDTMPGKGITLTDQEAFALAAALNDYFRKTWQD